MKVRELGQNPISQDKPAGEDAHYEPEFEELQQEIDKLSIASASGDSTDWKRVTSLCLTILSEKSKDLLVAAYLVTGLTKTHGFEGFTVGLAFLADLVENFWDTMFPPKRRMRGRMNAISWWMERMEDFLKSQSDAPPLTVEQMEAAKKNLDNLDRILGEKSDDAPSMRELGSYLSTVPVQEPEAAPEAAAPEPEAELDSKPEQPQAASQASPQQQPAPAQPQAPQPQAAAAPPPAAPQAVPPSASQKEADAAMKGALNTLLGVADFYLKNDPTNPLSYRLRRMGAWLPLSGPPIAQNGLTMLPPPESTIKPALEHLIQGRKYEAALHACEERVTESRFWLDITRLTATALDNLGGSYKDAYDALCGETLLMTQRLAGVENLGFSDGTPFADAETRAWLKSLSLGAGGDGLGGGGDEAQKAISEAFKEAHQQIKDKKNVAGLEVMHKGLASAGSGKEKLLWRIATGRLLLLAGRPDLADSMAAAALEDITAFRLEEWDPNLALQGLQLAFEACDALGKEEDKARAHEMLLRVGKLNPAEAMRISGAK